MSGTLTHSPADVLRYLLINLGVGTLPTAAGSWPINVSQEPNSPDSCITLYDTSGEKQGRVQVGGEVQEKHGIQFRIRAARFTTGYTKAQALAITIDESIEYDTITVDGVDYIVHAVSRRGGILYLGKEEPGSKRELFTLNAVVSLRQTS